VDAVAEVAELTAGGMKLKPAVALVADRHKLAKNTLYRAALEAREDASRE
jgi:16S rRNA (cytidine1402-2'-O)-methyltransferase